MHYDITSQHLSSETGWQKHKLIPLGSPVYSEVTMDLEVRYLDSAFFIPGVEGEKSALFTQLLIRLPNFDRVLVEADRDQAVNDVALFEVIQVQELEEVECERLALGVVSRHFVFCPLNQRIKYQLL